MARTDPKHPALVKGLRFIGSSRAAFKSLPGFQKGRHTVPDSPSPAAQAFLARLCADPLAEEAEALFQSARASLGYKRKELSLSNTPPEALLVSKDFSLAIAYSFDGDDCSSYLCTWTLYDCATMDFLRGEACSGVFVGRFDRLAFSLARGAGVEDMIDAIEGLPNCPISVSYPSDCSHCDLSVDGVAATLRFDGAELVMTFPRCGAPAELLDDFLHVREAFSLFGNKGVVRFE